MPNCPKCLKWLKTNQNLNVHLKNKTPCDKEKERSFILKEIQEIKKEILKLKINLIN